MLISEKLANLLHEQVGHELGASQAYLATAVYFAQKSLDGWADVFYKQSEEERAHAMKIIHFLVEVNAPFALPAIAEANPTKHSSEIAAVESALEQEKTVTRQFQHMAKVAHEEGDHIGGEFLQWFLVEQIEEEATMDKLREMLASGLNPFLAEPLLVAATAHGD